MIELTKTAADQVRQMLAKAGEPKKGLRVRVKGGGCSGLTYELAFETESRKGDKVFESQGVTIFVDLKSLIYLKGTVLDFQDNGMSGRKFSFVNPNAKKTCGCGESFST